LERKIISIDSQKKTFEKKTEKKNASMRNERMVGGKGGGDLSIHSKGKKVSR
jgi:DNA-binding protein YbaB